MKMIAILLITVSMGLLLSACAATPTGEAAAETGSDPKVEIKTNKGTIIAEIYESKTPITSGNFLKLVRSGFYDGLTYHRYEPGFVIQGGDPNGDGTGGSPDTIQLEIVPELKHEPFTLSMARTNDPNSASSQYFITLAATPFLDGGYAVFGRVVEGQDVVMQIRAGDKMESVKVLE